MKKNLAGIDGVDIGVIYHLTFNSNPRLRYIGQTTNLDKRLDLHRALASGRIPFDGLNRLVTIAWKAYGEPEVLILATVPRILLNQYEIMLIKDLGTLSPHGLNVHKGGQGRSNPPKV